MSTFRTLSFIVLSVMMVGATFVGGESISEEDANKKAVERRQKLEILKFFMGDPEDVQVPKSTIAIQLYNDAVKYYQSNDFDLARQTVKEAIAQDSGLAVAYELLGEIENLQQNLGEAKKNYEIAYNLQPSARVKDKLSKLKKEEKVDKKLKTYQEQHFIIKYNNQEQSYEGYELRDLLRKTYRQISQSLAYYFKHKVAVILYDEDDFRRVTDTPHWVQGVYDGKVRLPINKKGFSEKDLEALTAHEVTHAFVTFISSHKAPAWINEGMAEYQENKVKKVDTSSFQSAVRTRTLFPLHQLLSHGGPLSLNDNAKISLFYEQSYMLTEYLVKRYSMFHVKNIMKEYGSGKDSDQVIRSVLKISIARLEKEWHETISKSLS